MSDNDRGEPTPEQQREDRESRDTGGDAEAAGTLQEREAVARDEDDEFSDDGLGDGSGDGA